MNRFFRSLPLLSLLCCVAAVPAVTPAQIQRPGIHPRTGGMIPPPRTLTTPPLLVASSSKEVVKTASGEQFFIVASIDRQNSQLLLKRPTEVTLLVKIGPKTKYLDKDGHSTTLSGFRAGDTVWAKLSNDSTEPTVIEMREGQMTVADLHRYYLDYPIIK
jgi:hypothetical protein